MLNRSFQRAACGAIASLGLLAGTAHALTLNAAGGPIADGTAAGVGQTLFEFIDDNSPQTISTIETVTLTGLSHGYSSDLAVLLVYFPDDINAQGTSATLFEYINSGGTAANPNFYSNNLNGNYSFSDEAPTPNTLQNSVGADKDDADIAGGTFRPSAFYVQGQATQIDNLDAELGGQGFDLSVGSLYLYIVDYSAPDAGTLTSATVTLTTSPVPEPASLGALGAGAALLLRRRRA